MMAFLLPFSRKKIATLSWNRIFCSPSFCCHGQTLLEAVAVMSTLLLFCGFLFSVLFLGSSKALADILLHEALLCSEIEQSSDRCQRQCQTDLKSKLVFLKDPQVHIHDQGFQWKGSVDFHIPWVWKTKLHLEQILTKDD